MWIDSLEDDEIFVFGSNASGAHGGGAAQFAYSRGWAVWGEGHGLHGRSYAIDTMSGIDVLQREVAGFLEFARSHPELRFLLTPIGIGIAGYSTQEIAPLFADAPENVIRPEKFDLD